jgi:hypothetical protein
MTATILSTMSFNAGYWFWRRQFARVLAQQIEEIIRAGSDIVFIQGLVTPQARWSYHQATRGSYFWVEPRIAEYQTWGWYWYLPVITLASLLAYALPTFWPLWVWVLVLLLPPLWERLWLKWVDQRGQPTTPFNTALVSSGINWTGLVILLRKPRWVEWRLVHQLKWPLPAPVGARWRQYVAYWLDRCRVIGSCGQRRQWLPHSASFTIQALLRGANGQHHDVTLSNCYLQPRSLPILATRIHKLVKFHKLYNGSAGMSWCVGDMGVNAQDMHAIQSDPSSNWSTMDIQVVEQQSCIHTPTVQPEHRTLITIANSDHATAIHTTWTLHMHTPMNGWKGALPPSLITAFSNTSSISQGIIHTAR